MNTSAFSRQYSGSGLARQYSGPVTAGQAATAAYNAEIARQHAEIQAAAAAGLFAQVPYVPGPLLADGDTTDYEAIFAGQVCEDWQHSQQMYSDDTADLPATAGLAWQQDQQVNWVDVHEYVRQQQQQAAAVLAAEKAVDLAADLPTIDLLLVIADLLADFADRTAYLREITYILAIAYLFVQLQ